MTQCAPTANLSSPRGHAEPRADAARWLGGLRTRALAAAVGVLLAGWVVYYHLTVLVLPFDDAFITYRYVDNLRLGLGPVYNPGERVFGCSSPLHMLWLWAASTLAPGTDIPTLAVRLNALPYVVTLAAAALLLRRYTHSWAWPLLLAAGLAVHPRLLGISAGGMEPFLFLALALFSLLAASHRRATAAGLLAGLAALTRPEGVLLVPLVALAFARRPFSAGPLVRAAVAFAVPFGAWHLFAWWYFGSPIPHSVVAKAKPIYPIPPLYTFQWMLRYLGEWTVGGRFVGGRIVTAAAALSLTLLSAVLCVRKHDLRNVGAYGPGFMVLGLIGLYAWGNPLLFDWYLPPLVVFGWMAIVFALRAVAGGRLRGPSRVAGAALAIAWVMAVAFPVLSDGSGRISGPYDFERDPERLRVLAYREAAERMAPHLRPGDAVAPPEIGAFGFYSRARVLDPCGLVSPEALPFLPVPDGQRETPMTGAISTDFVEATRPAWVVTLSTFASRSLLVSDRFAAEYGLWDTVPMRTVWGSRHVLIYRRRDAAGAREGTAPSNPAAALYPPVTSHPCETCAVP